MGNIAMEFQRLEEAVKHFEKTKSQGDIYANFDLAVCYAKSNFEFGSTAQMVDLVNKGAKAGDPRAQYAKVVIDLVGNKNEGALLDLALLIVRNPTISVGEAYLALAGLMKQGIINSDLSYEEVLKRADHFGAREASALLAQYYQDKPDGEEASIEWLEKSAQKGDAVSLFNLSVLYIEGKAAPKDVTSAVRMLTASAGQGFIPALNMLGVMLFYGHDIEQDKEKAITLLKTAAKNGDSDALFNLGVIMLQSDEVKNSTAADFLKRSAELGNESAISLLKEFEKISTGE